MARVRDFLAVLVSMEIHDPTAAEPNDVGALVAVWLSQPGSCVSDPLDADDQVPRRPSDEYALNVEPQVVQTEQPLKPASNRIAAMTLAAQGMITREHVMDIVYEPVER
jgi:hypothetical protein